MDTATQSSIDYHTEKLNKYRQTGEIGSGLSLHATMAVSHMKSNWERVRPEWAAFERSHIDICVRVAEAVEDMCRKAKEFEFKHWMGFCDKDVAELLRLRHQWDCFDWEHGSEEEKEKLRALWDPQPNSLNDESYWKPAWQKYLDRRNKKPLKDTCLELSPCSATTDHYKVMMMSTGGRVLITVQDRYAQEHKKSKFGGAWISMIFDESAGWPRGGVQGHCATRDEGVGLIQALIDDMPKMKPDKNIGIG
jgi:hypothetical protein